MLIHSIPGRYLICICLLVHCLSSPVSSIPAGAISTVSHCETKFDHRGEHTLGMQKYFRMNGERWLLHMVRDVSKLPFQVYVNNCIILHIKSKVF